MRRDWEDRTLGHDRRQTPPPQGCGCCMGKGAAILVLISGVSLLSTQVKQQKWEHKPVPQEQVNLFSQGDGK